MGVRSFDENGHERRVRVAVGRLLAWPLRIVLSLALILHLLVLGLMSLGWNLVAMVLYPLLPRARGLALGRTGVARVYGSFWTLAAWTGMLRIDSSVLDVLREERGLIVVANHPSMLDALILVARLPRSACIMKAELMRNVFLGAGARLAGYIRNDSARGMIRLAVEDLKQGGQLIIFPEGTRTTQPPVNPFRPGVTLIAKLAQVPIQTVFIDTDSPYLGKGWPIWRLPPLPVVFKVRLGERFAPQKDSDALLAELEHYIAAGVKPPCPPAS
jgi:1-acyl-sn-glycerol-3-phosphate acyltransferase